MPPPQTRSVLKRASRADATMRRYAAAVARPSSSSMGMTFAPRAKNATPLTRKYMPWEAVPVSSAAAATYAGSVSSPVTSAK